MFSHRVLTYCRGILRLSLSRLHGTQALPSAGVGFVFEAFGKFSVRFRRSFAMLHKVR